MAAINPLEILNYLVANGVSRQYAAGILANIQFESNFNPTAVGDNGTSGGLFQHHLGRWDNLKDYAASTGRHWSDWQAQVDFALIEANQMGLDLTGTDARAAAREWTLKFERPADAQRKAEQRANAVVRYEQLVPTSVQSPGSGNASIAGASERVNVPEGGSWFNHPEGGFVVAFRIHGIDNANQVIYYRSDAAPPQGTQVLSQASFEKWQAAWVDGGTTDAFSGVPPGKTYDDLFQDVLFQLGLAGTDALSDQGVIDVVALAMTREISPTELANRLRNTNWWQSRSDAEREWDDLSPAEREQRIVDSASQLVGLWFTYVGEDLGMADYDSDGDGVVTVSDLEAANPDLADWAERVASGQASQATAVNTWLKEAALEVPESPWARTVREEEQAQGQHAVDVSNMVGQIRDLYFQWGMPLADSAAENLANQVIMNDMSIEEVEEAVRTQANGLFPHKPEMITTREWAQPYMQTYMQTLEMPEVELEDPLVQTALSEGMNLADFRQTLRADERWLETDGARVEMNDKISAIGRVMGF